MDDIDLTLHPVGVARTPYETPEAAPHQGFADDVDAEIEIFDALAGVADAVRITVVYWAHMADRSSTRESGEPGAFARRSPNRPNPLSICVCTVYGLDGQRLRVGGLDAIDGSPVLDIKPSLQTER
jgi:tRNA-Thr(GGU) m(6)t(6)A37 methyltransferase TsaA